MPITIIFMANSVDTLLLALCASSISKHCDRCGKITAFLQDDEHAEVSRTLNLQAAFQICKTF